MVTLCLTMKTRNSYFVKYFYSPRFIGLQTFRELEMIELSMLRSNIQHSGTTDILLKSRTLCFFQLPEHDEYVHWMK